MALFLHNTLTRSRQRFEPADPGRVTMYVCGPTVYNYAHIGNARPYVIFDVLQRLLRRSYTLTYARNVTDVDDKINDAAAARGTFKRNCCTAGFLSAGRSRSSAACDRPAGDASAAPMAAPVAAPILER